MKKKSTIFFASILFFLSGSLGLSAQNDAILSFSSAGTFGGTYTLGWMFSTSTPITVTQLGAQDINSDGLTGAIPVKIYQDGTQSLMASATVPSGTVASLSNGYRYVNITPVILPPGTYRISAWTAGGELNEMGTPTLHSDLTFISGCYEYIDGYPINDGGGPYMNPNFRFTTCVNNQSVTASQTSFCSSGSTTVNLVGSETGVNYYLRNDANDTVINGPLAGTGSGISLNTGTITSTTTYNVYADKIGSAAVGALNFTGNGGLKKVSLGTNIWTDNFVGTNQLTVESWVNRSSLGSLHSIIGNYDGSYPFLFRIDGDKITLFLNSATSVQSISTIPVGVWTHVAGTYDGTNLKVYINGVLEGTQPYTSNFIGTTNEVKIGGGLSNNTEYFPGDIADVRLWNVARSQVQINADKDIVLNGNETGLIANYQFTEGSGSAATNSATGNAYPGTLVNSPAWVTGPILTGTTCSQEMLQLVTVTIKQPTTGSQTLVECQGFSVTVGTNTYNATGVYTDVLVGSNGCDSTVTTDLTVEQAIDVTVDNTLTPTLSANQTGATYQWVDCDNSNAPISGEINQTFTATTNGNYAVEVTVGSCTETSACENITGVGINETANHVVSIYPNPTNGMVNINLGSNNSTVNYSITSIEGKVIETGKTSTNNITVDLSNESKGVYFVKINTENTSTVYKLIKQ